MSFIHSVGTCVPAFSYSPSEILKYSADWLGEHPSEFDKFERFLYASKTERRNFILPAESLFDLGGAKDRAEKFQRLALPLAERSIEAALGAAGLTVSQIGAFVSTSCSCPVIPALDVSLIQRVGFSAMIDRLPVYQHGCAGGVVGLSLASRFTHQHSAVLLSSVELCSLVFRPDNLNTEQLVGAAIFADGAATAVIRDVPGPLEIIDCQSFLVPETQHLMGYDIFDDGAHLRLNRDLPRYLAQIVPELVSDFLRKHQLTRAVIPWWLFHPGGSKILDFLESEVATTREGARFSREVFEAVGNLSSATVLFVLERFLEQAPLQEGDYAVLLGVGPGITIEVVLLRSTVSR